MSMSAGGSLGVTFPDGTNTAPVNVTDKLGPALTDTANILTINPPSIFSGTGGLTANGTTYTTAPPLTYSSSYFIAAGMSCAHIKRYFSRCSSSYHSS